MVRVVAKLVIIFVLISAGVYVGYGQLKKRLLVMPSVVPHQAAHEKQAEKARQVLQKTSNYQIIVTRNIFEAVIDQKLELKKKEPLQVEKEPEPTTLKLILQGTVSGNDQDARAIIVDQNKRQQDLYQIGDAVQNALITAIDRGKVVLEVNGKKQLLLIKDREGGGGGGNVGGESGFVPKSRASSFVMKPSRTAFSKKSREPTPAVEPHRRISFKQDKDEGNDDIEPVEQVETEEPLVEEDLQEDVIQPERSALVTDESSDENIVPPEGSATDTESPDEDVAPLEENGLDTESQE